MSDEYEGPERRKNTKLTDDDLDRIAEAAAARALKKVYADIGKSVVNKFLWLLGAGALGLLYYLSGKGVQIK